VELRPHRRWSSGLTVIRSRRWSSGLTVIAIAMRWSSYSGVIHQTDGPKSARSVIVRRRGASRLSTSYFALQTTRIFIGGSLRRFSFSQEVPLLSGGSLRTRRSATETLKLSTIGGSLRRTAAE